MDTEGKGSQCNPSISLLLVLFLNQTPKVRAPSALSSDIKDGRRCVTESRQRLLLTPGQDNKILPCSVTDLFGPFCNRPMEKEPLYSLLKDSE